MPSFGLDNFNRGVLTGAGQAIVIPCKDRSTFAIDLSGTFNMTVTIEGSLDGNVWRVIPVEGETLGFAASIAGSVGGIWTGYCAPYRQLRARCSTYVSGSASVILSSDDSQLDDSKRAVEHLCVKNAGIAGNAMTITLPAPGVGLRQYVSYIRLTRTAAGLLTAAATPLLITTTNLPGDPVFAMGAEADPLGKMQEYSDSLYRARPAVVKNTALTFVCPATPNVVWRGQVGYYVAP
jgi:hypothetical protein